MESKTTQATNFLNIFSGKFKGNRIENSVALWLTLLLTVLMSANIWAQTVTTDKSDYAPGELVDITGSGWAANERVDFKIEHLIFTDHPDEFYYTYANSLGEIHYTSYFIDPWDLGESFILTATGLSSGLSAVTYFTDGNVKFSASGLPNGISVTVNYSGTSSTGSFSGSIALTTPGNSSNISQTPLNGTSFTYTFPATKIIGSDTYTLTPAGSQTVTIGNSAANYLGTYVLEGGSGGLTVTAPLCAQGGEFTITYTPASGTAVTETKTTPFSFTAKKNTSYSITSIASPVNGNAYTGSATVYGTTPNSNDFTEEVILAYTDDEKPVITDEADILQTADAGLCSAIVTIVDATATDNCSVGAVTGTRSDALALTDPYPVGETTITWTVTDINGNDALSVTQKVTVTDDELPEITCPSPEASYTVDSELCSTSLTFGATTDDNCGVASTVYSVDGTEITYPYAFPAGTTTVDVLVTDIHDNSNSCSFDVVVTNSAPSNIVITGQVSPQSIHSDIDVSATFVDENIATATWIAFDGNSDVQTETLNIAGTSTNHTFVDLPVGVYTIILKLKDHCDLETVERWQYAVIYDPNGGFVTGGGWIYSKPGASTLYPLAEGKANFGFNAKYKTGKNNTTEVDGNTEFQFKAGNFNFKSSSHDDMSLVISGEKKATYRGVGTVNGAGSHKFMVTVIDGDAPGGDGDDKFRIKVWASGSSSNVIYDNENSSAENVDANTLLGGGSIVIHKPKGKGNTSTKAEHPIEVVAELLPFNVTAYPNPSADYFMLKLQGLSYEASQKVEVNVFDLLGRQVYSKQGSAQDAYEFGQQFQVGVYLVTVKQGNNIASLKVIKK